MISYQKKNNINASNWVIRDANNVIMMARREHLGNTSVITVEYVGFERWGSSSYK